VMTVEWDWRKNRRVDPESSCIGVDLNRNLDIPGRLPTFKHESAGAIGAVHDGRSASPEPVGPR
jgi:hypothetical protein